MTYLKENFLQKHYQIFILFLIFFLIRQGTSCELTKVLSCPDTKQKWDIAALKKNCSSNSNCSDYHCVPTETNQTVEVCAKPLHLQGVCPFFDTVGQRLQMTEVSCLSTNQNESCSARYISTTVYKYKVCFPSHLQPISGTPSIYASGIGKHSWIRYFAIIFVMFIRQNQWWK